MSCCAGEGREMRARQEAAGLVFARGEGIGSPVVGGQQL
jgi:hypothetical protein